jgi:hypothetical protein
MVDRFEHEGVARRFMADMRQRMEKFGLSLHPQRTLGNGSVADNLTIALNHHHYEALRRKSFL